MITERELEILELSKKLNQLEISKKLKISQPAVSKIYNNALRKIKDAKETLELANAANKKEFIEELTDTLEVLQTLISAVEADMDQVEKKMIEKKQERGGFVKGLILEYDDGKTCEEE